MKQMRLLQWVENTLGELMYPVKSGEYIEQVPQGSPFSLAVLACNQVAELVVWYLRNEDAFISGIEWISSMTFCSTPDADAQLFSWSLFNAYFL